MFRLWEWLTSILSFLGLHRKTGKLLLVGIDNAGKTALLNRLARKLVVHTAPTQHATCEELTLGGMTFTTYDIGGHKQVRRIWKDYFPVVDGIVFIIDSSDSDHERLLEAKKELHNLLSDEMIANVPMLILGNKIDKDGAFSEYQLLTIFELHNIRTGHDEKTNRRPVELFMCSVLKQHGYGEGFRWLAQHLK